MKTQSAWRNLGPRFYWLFTAYLVSDTGTWLYRLTLPLLVLHMTGSALQTAALYALEYGPFLVLSLPGGVFADRFDRKTILVGGDLAAGVIALTLALLVTDGISSLWAIYIVALLLACVDPLYHPAFQALVPSIVRDEGLEQANTLLQGSDNLLSLLGPVLAGTMIGVFGYEGAVYIDAGSFFGSALIISLIRIGLRQRSRPARSAAFLAELREGLHYITRANRRLLAGALLFTGTNFGIWLIQANLIFYLSVYLKLSAALIGVVYGAQGAGAVAGALIAPLVIRRIGNSRAIVLSTIAAGLLTLLLLVFRDIAGVSATFAAVFVLGSINVVSWFTLRQRIVPPELLGRAVAATRMLAYASIPVAAIVAGVLEETLHSMYLVILIGALIRCGVGIIGLRTTLMTKEERRPELDGELVD
jgi:MFS family permease